MRIFNLFDEKFEDMNAGLNVALMQVAKKIANEEFEQGEITLKLKIGTVYEQKDGKAYKMPAFTYKISTNLQKKSSTDGGDAYQGMEFKLDDEVVVLERVKTNQMDMFEEDEEE